MLAVPLTRHASDIDPSAAETDVVEMLQIVTCPFAEDLRDFQFPSLEGEKWKSTDEQDRVVDDLIDGFDLGTSY